MRSYVLLRNNNQYGPYTLAELQSFTLKPNDLIWIEGESKSWRFISEFEEVTCSKSDTRKKPLPQVHKASAGIAIPSFDTENTLQALEDNNANHCSNKADIYSGSKIRRRKITSVRTDIFGLVVWTIGIAFSAFVVKNIMEGFNEKKFFPTAEAITITEEILPTSTTENTAEMGAIQETSSTPLIASVNHTDTRQLVRVKPTTETSLKTVVPTNDTMTKNDEVSGDEPAMVLKEESFEKTEKVIVSQPIEISSLQVSANDYKVGLFGGISDLELSITNSSSQPIAKAVIEVEYLKPNGNVAKSQTIVAEDILAGSSKALTVPSSSRGVKIRYKVISAEAK